MYARLIKALGTTLARAGVVVAALALAPSSQAAHGGSDHLLPTRDNVDLVSKLKLDDRFGDVKPNQIADVAVHGNHAFLASSFITGPDACARGGVHVVDISDLGNPQEVGFIAAPTGSAATDGLHVISMNTPSFTGDLLTYSTARCGASGAGVSFVDVTNPRAPVPLGQATDTTTGPGATPVSSPHSMQSAFSWQDGNRAYTVAADSFDGPNSNVDIFEITNPVAPVKLRETGADDYPGVDGGAHGFSAVAFTEAQVKRIDGVQTMLLSYEDRGWFKLNVDDPGNPTQIGPDFDFSNPDPALPGFASEGNAHQGWFDRGNEFILGASQDLRPFRGTGEITAGLNTGFKLAYFPAAGTRQVTSDDPLTGDTRFVGQACDGMFQAASGDVTIAVAERGACDFQVKYNNAKALGYQGVVVFNSPTGAPPCEGFVNPGVTDGAPDAIPFLFVARSDGFRIIDAYDGATYSCSEQTGTGTAAPAPPRDGSPVSFTVRFDGWGYVRLIDAASMEQLDSHAVQEGVTENFAENFGDLSAHEVRTDDQASLAYASYYSGGLRVLSLSRGGLDEVGRYVDQEGSDLWGAVPFAKDNARFIAGSDRDFGLYLFRYTGPGAAKAPSCSNGAVQVPSGGTVTVPLSCTDENGNAITRSIVSGPGNGTLGGIDQGAGTVAYTHTAGGPSDSFTFRASDGEFQSGLATAQISVLSSPAATPELPRLASKVAARWKATRTYTLVKALAATKLDRGATVRVTCKSKRKKACPKARTINVRSATAKLNLAKPFKGKKLPLKTVLEIRITRPGFVGRVFRFTVRRSAKPKSQALCLSPGASKPGRCS